MTDELEEQMLRASEGNEQAAEKFYRAFFGCNFFVPERYQQQQLRNPPDYPNDFVNVLGVKNADGAVLVPIFTKAENIERWAGQGLVHKEMSGTKLLELVPKGWSLCINPAGEVEKEISPWEIELLRGGESGIPAIMDELFSAELIETLMLHPVKDDEYSELKSTLIQEASKIAEVQALYLLKEEGKDLEDKIVYSVVLGIETSAESHEDVVEIKETLGAVADRVQIGGDPVRVRIGDSVKDNVMLGIFLEIKPFYESLARQRNPSILNKISGLFGKK